MTKRRERLSPVIDAERRKSGVLERRAHGLEAECVQLGRDLKLAREAVAKAVETIRSLQVQLVAERKTARSLRGDVERWKSRAETAWAWNCTLRDMTIWRIAAQRIAARFRGAA